MSESEKPREVEITHPAQPHTNSVKSSTGDQALPLARLIGRAWTRLGPVPEPWHDQEGVSASRAG